MQAQFDQAAAETSLEDPTRKLPSEMQSRPKIPRTPADAGRVGALPGGKLLARAQDIPQQLGPDPIVPKIKGQEVTGEKEIAEFKEGFVAKQERIPRTPPEQPVFRDPINPAFTQDPMAPRPLQPHARPPNNIYTQGIPPAQYAQQSLRPRALPPQRPA